MVRDRDTLTWGITPCVSPKIFQEALLADLTLTSLVGPEYAPVGVIRELLVATDALRLGHVMYVQLELDGEYVYVSFHLEWLFTYSHGFHPTRHLYDIGWLFASSC